ncbi:hypothetical protein [Pseudocnuella soli]|uniref:hypothetical protein n=1 Tax=Pseudocnuella soli TaxID=2502779 RepID=UPI00104EDAF1|nr:hypothetical protein [Pseudocnuella soli]
MKQNRITKRFGDTKSTDFLSLKKLLVVWVNSLYLCTPENGEWSSLSGWFLGSCGVFKKGEALKFLKKLLVVVFGSLIFALPITKEGFV